MIRAAPHNKSGGFTLLEVLLAFVIFSISFAVVLQIISG
jgi:prepilin-type N-terminal cleavage/methylation domain-containing protein